MSFLSDMTLEQPEIEILFQAIDRWCSGIGTPVDSDDGRDVATVMLALYKTGHTTETALLEAMGRINPDESVQG